MQLRAEPEPEQAEHARRGMQNRQVISVGQHVLTAHDGPETGEINTHYDTRLHKVSVTSHVKGQSERDHPAYSQ